MRNVPRLLERWRRIYGGTNAPRVLPARPRIPPPPPPPQRERFGPSSPQPATRFVTREAQIGGTITMPRNAGPFVAACAMFVTHIGADGYEHEIPYGLTVLAGDEVAVTVEEDGTPSLTLTRKLTPPRREAER